MSSKQRSIARRMAALQLENEGFKRTHRHYRKKEDPEYEKKSFFAHNWKKAFRNKQKFDEKRKKEKKHAAFYKDEIGGILNDKDLC